MKKIAPILFISLNLFSQNDTIFNNFKKIEMRKIDSLTSFYREKNSLKFLAILPNLSYDLRNNSVNVGLNISNLSSYFIVKKRNDIEFERLKFQLFQDLNNKLEKLESEYLNLKNQFEFLQLENQNFELKKELFELKKSQYEKNKIPLETWLQVQELHKSAVYGLVIRKTNLKARIIEFSKKIKSPCLQQELEKLSSNNNNL